MNPLPEAIPRESIGEVKYGVNRFGYRIDGQFYRRVTTQLRGIPKDWMSAWKIKMAAKKILDRPDEIPTDEVELKKWLNAASDDYRDERADRGSAIHAAVEAIMDGQSIPGWTDEDAYDCAVSVERYIEARGIRPLYAELTLYSPRYEYAGTTDLWFTVGDEYGLLDWKSSKDVYTEAAVQVAGFYRHAEYAIIEKFPIPGKSDEWTGRVIPWTPEYAEHVFVNHVTPDGVREFPVDPELYEYLWVTARAARHIKEFLRKTNSYRKNPELSVYAEPNEYPREGSPRIAEEALSSDLEASINGKEAVA